MFLYEKKRFRFFATLLQILNVVQWGNMRYQKNGKLLNKEQVSAEDRAFMYGDGCFTTARWSQGEIKLWARHLQRFAHAFSALALNCTIERIEHDLQHFLTHLTEYDYGTIKIVISRGVSARGYALPEHDADIYFYFYPAQVQQQPTLIQSIGMLSEQLGSTLASLKGIKTLNRLEQVMLKHTAQKYGWVDALCFDAHQHVVEAISSNCFFYLNDTWVTPDLELTGIQGTMRAELLERMAHYQIAHQVRIITASEIAHAQALFLCNALQPMQMVETLVNQQGEVISLDLQPCHQLFRRLSLSQLV